VDVDVLCLTEVKCSESDHAFDFKQAGYNHVYWHESRVKKGYAGTAIACKTEAKCVSFGCGGDGEPGTDGEGRCITIDLGACYVVLTYTPNSGEDLKFADKRKAWDSQFRQHLHKLEESKPVVWTGDMNVAHLPFDVYDGEKNRARQKGAGFTMYEREAMDTLIVEDGFVDAYRLLHKEEKTNHYTFFTYRQKMKVKNKGWRLDYFIVSPELIPVINAVTIHREEECSDHVPIVLHFN